MAKEWLTDEQVEIEIGRIRETDAYKLAIAEQKFKYRQRQRLYQMRWYEKHGNDLMKQGKTFEDFKVTD